MYHRGLYRFGVSEPRDDCERQLLLRPFDGRPEATDVAVRIDHDALVLSPFGVLRKSHACARRHPLLCQVVRILYESSESSTNRYAELGVEA
jgi:hypothetical protein